MSDIPFLVFPLGVCPRSHVMLCFVVGTVDEQFGVYLYCILLSSGVLPLFCLSAADSVDEGVKVAAGRKYRDLCLGSSSARAHGPEERELLSGPSNLSWHITQKVAPASPPFAPL